MSDGLTEYSRIIHPELIAVVRRPDFGKPEKLSTPPKKFSSRVLPYIASWIRYFQDEAQYFALDTQIRAFRNASIKEVCGEYPNGVLYIARINRPENPLADLSVEILLDLRPKRLQAATRVVPKDDFEQEPPFINPEAWGIKW
jgi:hypothetical protein